PDGQHALPLLVAEDDDGHVGDRIHHQPLDRHFDLHGSPRKLFGFAPVIRTCTIRPTHDGSPGKLTTVLPDVRPESSHSRRRLVASTRTRSTRPPPAPRTGSTRPTAASKSSPWIRFWSACSATMRRVFSSSLTSSGMRFSASVFGQIGRASCRGKSV